VVYTDLGSPGQITFRESGKPLHIKVSGHLRTNNSEVIRSALLEGLGIAQAPRWLIGDKVAKGELVEVLSGFQSAPSSVHVVYSPGLHVPSKLRCFIDHFADEFKNCGVINGPEAKAA
jgi:LysR family transcriptional regulator for bpeEF and oprC